MPREPFRSRDGAIPKDRYQTEVESWRELQAYQPHPLIHRIIKLLYQSEADLVIAVGRAQVRKVPRHQCRCDTSTARILSDAQPSLRSLRV